MNTAYVRWANRIACLQGLYFFVFGLWPLIDVRSFKLVTGEKTDHLVTGDEADHWLVFTVAVLIVVIGCVLLVAAWRSTAQLEMALLGIGSAIGLAAIDCIYVWRETISSVYLLDAAIEVAFVLAWLTWWACFRRAS